ncbi:cilia- and flagella-associated protein 100-like [Pomacea canaliculata]|uniref:cilia- and flagella-associated protein 100-like n=1 Tax=Pomacea canaliculata TaxID=400727 RepID=UPI000D73E2F6|nr:cilia- and flagella-associated protein 100-like [Pomacea canaliculata]
MSASPAQRSPQSSVQSGKKSRQENISRLTGQVTFPPSAKSAFNAAGRQQEKVPKDNPFRMPPDSDIFVLRDKERQNKRKETQRQHKLHVHEKTTYNTRINYRNSAMIQPKPSDDEAEQESDNAVAVKDDPQFTIAVTRDRHVEKESLSEYIAKKREMFLVQYSLGVKRDEMRKLEEIAQAEERKLELAEQFLEEDAAMFDEFLKENDKNSVEAIKIAEAEAKLKMEKVNEIKKINVQIMSIKSEISKYEEMLKEYQQYRRFLEALTPPEIRQEKEQQRKMMREIKKTEREKSNQLKKSPSDLDRQGTGDLKGGKKKLPVPKAKTISGSASSSKTKVAGAHQAEDALSPSTLSDSDSDEEMELYFQDPQQLLDIFSELEEQNLSLIQNSQETEEALEEMKHTMKMTKDRMTKETKILKDQIEKLEKAIKAEEDKAADLKIKAKMFNYGEFKEEDQEKSLQQLNQKVEEVYRSCIGDNEANISTLQMLTNIENRLEELFEIIETMPQDKVEAAEKAKEKERRLKMREEKIELQRLHQEERVKRALERAKAEPKKKTGKKLVFRSEPPQLKKKEDEGADQASREEEELAYYFQW